MSNLNFVPFKYIRIKDKILEVYNMIKIYNVNEELTGYCCKGEKEAICETCVLEKSNNIEDLLDAFLCENKLGQGTCNRDFTELKRDALHSVWQQHLIRGKTWDDLQFSFYGLMKQNQDLICVAKYNTKTNEWKLI